MEVQLGILVLFVFLSGASTSSSSELTYTLLLTPAIHPNQNFTFSFSTENKSPSKSYRLQFSIVDLSTNESVSTVELKIIPPAGGQTWDEVTMEPPRSFSLRPFALRTRVIRLPEDSDLSSRPNVVEESLTSLKFDLRNSSLLIKLHKRENEYYVQGDTVYFSVLLLDKNHRVSESPKNITISIWKLFPERYLLRRWTSVEIRPNRPFINGEFQIPHAYYFPAGTREDFEIYVTLDEREIDDPSHSQSISVPHSSTEDAFQRHLTDLNPLFYSSAVRNIQTKPEYHNPFDWHLSAITSSEFVTLKNPNFTVELTAMNEFIHPATSGRCTIIQTTSPHRCTHKEREFKRSIVNGKISLELEFLRQDLPNCNESSDYELLEPLTSYLTFHCGDEATEAGKSLYAINMPINLLQTEFVIDFINPNEDTLLFKVTRRDVLPLGEVTEKLPLQVNYIFKNGSILEVKEPLLEDGYVAHKSRVHILSDDLKQVTASFGDATYSNIIKRFAVNSSTKAPFLWKPWPFNLNSSFGPSLTFDTFPSLPLISILPLEYPLIVTANNDPLGFGITQTFVLRISKTSPSLPFLSFVDLNSFKIRKTSSRQRLQFMDLGIIFNVTDSLRDDNKVRFRLKSPRVAISSLGNRSITLSSQQDGNSPKVFGFGSKTSELDESFDFHQMVEGPKLCVSSNDPHPFNEAFLQSCPDPSADSKVFQDIVLNRQAAVEDARLSSTREGKGTARLHLGEVDFPEWSSSWLWTSSNLSSDIKSLSIKRNVPLGSTAAEELIGVLIDDANGFRLTQSVIFKPESVFTIEVTAKNESRPRHMTMTIINNSNTTLNQLNLFQEDLNKVVVFKSSTQNKYTHAINTTLNFDVLPFSRRVVELSFETDKIGFAHLLLIVSSNSNYASSHVKFFTFPQTLSVIESVPILINNVNTTQNDVKFSFDSPHLQNRPNGRSFLVDAVLTYNFLFKFHTVLLSYFVDESSGDPLEALVQKSLAVEFLVTEGFLTHLTESLLGDEVDKFIETSVPANFSRGEFTCDLIHVFLQVKTIQGQLYTQHLERAVDLVLEEFNRMSKDSFDEFQNTTFNRVSCLLALHATKEYTTNGQQIKQIVSKEAVKLSNRFQNSTDFLELLLMTHFFDELDDTQADNFFGRAKQLEAKRDLIDYNEHNFTKFERTLLETSLLLLASLHRDDLLTSYPLAMQLKRLRTPNALAMKALTRFVKAALVAPSPGERVQVAVSGDPQGELVIRATGQGTAFFYPILFIFDTPHYSG